MVTNWLVGIGMLDEVENLEGKKTKRPTPDGNELGISLEERMGSTGPYHVVIYNKSAQQFIVDNIFTILEYHKRTLK